MKTGYLHVSHSQSPFVDISSTSNDMFGRVFWDKLPECSFENVEVA